MMIGHWLRPPRRALTLFVASSTALAMAFGVLAWRLVRQDRDAEQQRIAARVSDSVDLLAVTLRNRLNELDLRLTAIGAAGAPEADGQAPMADVAGEAGVVVFLTSNDIRVWPEDRLAYWPSAPDVPAIPSQAQRAADLLTQARRARERGQDAAAFAAYDRLAAIDAPVLNDAPAALVARHARARLLSDLGRTADARNEAVALLRSLREPTWRLSAGQYRYYASEARRWLTDDQGTSDHPTGSEALAAAVTSLWDRWSASPPLDATQRETMWVDRRPFLVISRVVAAGVVAFIGDVGLLQSAVDEVSGGRASAAALDVALVDNSNTPILGTMPSAVAGRVVRTTGEAGLPWSIYAAPNMKGATPDSGLVRRRAILGGAALVGLCVLAGGWASARALHRELEAARVQRDFVSAVSHEFRTPVTAFEQLSELLVDGRVASDADRQDYYRRLHRESRRLRRLVEDLLDFRRMEAGAHEFTPAVIDPSSFVKGIIEEFQSDGPVRIAALSVVVPNEVDDISIDRSAVARALWNLLDNAAKYAPGSPVRVAVLARAGQVGIAVQDRGPGIPDDRQQLIFDAFVRGGGPAGSAVAGTGLGLAMVRHIVQTHGGHVTVESEVGRGATFTMWFRTAGVPGRGV